MGMSGRWLQDGNNGYARTLDTGWEQWVCQDVGYRMGTMGMSRRWLQDRNNGYVMTLFTGLSMSGRVRLVIVYDVFYRWRTFLH